ncbi:hypothetical protein PVW51_01580 [Sulfitobacter sp. PR48]|jgi:hypothetical protein|uniref:Uncharacterized protein n=1 Tax=Sulfitobacter porphyrae TaxID=1246864 RepID=A0ABW2B696_9RHOB|nr:MULTISPECIES: hypothetical protein [unclassified Sulfitobacter]MCZ4255831.1 hypothetical protein [Sulfitobacter sp. G21635-S1]MDD9719358.1 hypothetical protein [Sulfitobacter sp. PR48]GLT12845.1 hypothetical protein GCM10007928_50780 [Sulfitobacter porphyrae]
MAHQSNTISEKQSDDRGLSQAIFIMVGIGIILGGLWFLYQSTAPYHPDVTGGQEEIYLSTDS